jgi:phosphatidate cytidylyltransferase
MPLNVPVFFTRLASSVVFVAIMFAGLLWNEWSFLVLICLINVLCLREYFRVMKHIDKDSYWPSWLPVVFIILSSLYLLYATSLWTLRDDVNTDMHREGNVFYFYIFLYARIALLHCLLPLLPVVLMLAGILSKKVYYVNVFKAIGGLLYITLPMFCLFCMYKLNPFIPVVLIVMIWSNDTMAYLVGSFFGKRQFSSISPKKTWEGTIGGAVITIVAAALTGYFSHSFSIIDWIIVALCATIAGTFGDLMESKLKRMADLKDSGVLMPGHGGALDRFDSLLVAIPFAFVYVMYFMR